MYYGWILLPTIGFIYMACVGAAFYGLSVMMPAMIEDFGWTRAEATTGFAILSLLVGFAGPPVTALMKKISPRLTIIIGGFIGAAGAYILSICESLPVYYMGAAVLACGMTMQAVLPGIQLVTQWFHRRRSLALGIFMASGGLGGVVGAPSFTWLIQWFGDWRPVWLFVGGVSLLGTLLSWLVIRNHPEDVGQRIDGIDKESADDENTNDQRASGVYKTNRDWTVKEAFRDPTYWIILVSGSLAVTGQMIVTSQLVLHVKDIGMTAIIAATALGIQGLFTTSGRFISGLLGDYAIEPRTLFLLGMACEFIGLFLLTGATSVFALYTSVVFFGLGFGLGLVGATTMLANYYGAINTPTLLSYRILLGTVLGSIGIITAGYCGDIYGGYTEVFYGFSVFLFVATLLVLLIKIPNAEETEST